jgi:hypothetical protein
MELKQTCSEKDDNENSRTHNLPNLPLNVLLKNCDSEYELV